MDKFRPWQRRIGDAVEVEGVDPELDTSGRAFLRAACSVLASQRVIPPPVFHPHIELGRDYFGPDLSELPEFAALETAVTNASPRFAETVPLSDRDFASSYIFSFLETFVARACISDEDISPVGVAATLALEDLQKAIDASSWEVACCRVVSHLSTSDGERLDISGVSVVPVESGFGGRRHAHDVIESVIPGVESAYARVTPLVYAPPESVVIATGSSEAPFDLAGHLSGEIERLLLLTRLLHAGTCESVHEVQGETGLVRRFKPTLVRFRGTGGTLISSTHMLRRAVRLSAADGPRFDGLWRLIGLAEQDRPGMALTSFAMAMEKFRLSYHAHTWYEQLVDLATALEAAISGKDTTDVLLRLRGRCAALLWTDRDPSSAIFSDIAKLYALRSSLVHGGELKEKQLLRVVRSVSTVPEDAPFGVALGHVVDRLRDLVRRSLLARICLAEGDDPIWALGEDEGVDSKLADDASRSQWRTAWRNTLAGFDALGAADRPQPAASFISPLTED